MTTYLKTTAVIVIAAWLGGCCGMTNIQAHGGGAGGFASLGALIVGSTAMQRLCEPDRGSEEGDDGALPPPDTTPEADEDTDKSVHNAATWLASSTPHSQELVASRQTSACLD
ncbi:MAG: hypothetical protein U5P41_01415 [Gammaproteobacteria bacterium]|nr:hypothetical protein [Gammaproteobacteria bacterium]